MNPRGAATSCFFEHGRTIAYGAQTPIVSAGSSGAAQAVSAQLSGLTLSTSHHYRLVALRGSDSYPGEDRTFTTAATPADPPDPGPSTGSTTPGSTTGSGTTTGPGSGTRSPTSSSLDELRRLARTAKARCWRSKGKPACTVTANGKARVSSS